MKKILLFLCITLIASPLFAQNIKIIELSDGSMIKGEIIDFEDDVYTVETNAFGTVELEDEDIVSISSATATTQTKMNTTNEETEIMPSGDNLMQKAQQLQGSMMADPQVMSEMQNLLANPEIMSILTDQNFINMLMENPEMMLENDKLKVLMENPQIQQLMETVMEKQLITQ